MTGKDRISAAALALLARDHRHEHAPRTEAEFRCALAELRSRGYSEQQIASALGAAPEAVKAMLEVGADE